MKSLSITALPLMFALLFSIPTHANNKKILVEPRDRATAVVAFFVIGCTPVPGMDAQITVQPQHGTAIITSGSYTDDNCPGVQFPGIEADYTWTDPSGQPGSGADAFHVTFTAPPGHSQTVDYDIDVWEGFSGKLLGQPDCHCNANDASTDVDNTGMATAADPAIGWISMPYRASGPSPHGPGPNAPVNVASGNLSYRVTDYQTAGPNPLALTRYYNSGASVSSFAKTLGPNWRTNYDRYIDILTPTVVHAERPSGQVLTFFLNAGVWTTDADVDVTLVQSGSLWTLTDLNDTVETYNTVSPTEAALSTIRARNGYLQTLQYDGTNRLLSVTDSYNRSLTFNYSNGLLSTLATPENNNISYAYNANNTLASMTSAADAASGPTYSYIYGATDPLTNAPILPNALTGVLDLYGDNPHNWTYDITGRVLSSSQGGAGVAANTTVMTYNDTDGSRTVTNAAGVTHNYSFTTLQSVPKVAQISRPTVAGTLAMTRAFSYDTSGYLASATDWNGALTTYTNNAHGQPTIIIEASGLPGSRATIISYNGTFPHLPASITSAGLVASFTYDGSGNLLTKTLTDQSLGGTARTWNYSYDAAGHMLSVKAPRADVNATTNFTYDASGALTSVTDALNHTTSITAHTAGGYPQTIVDPNGVTTTLTYDGQMRVTASTVATTAGPLQTQYSYWIGNALFSVTLPDGSAIYTFLDAALRPLYLSDTVGNYVAYTLDSLGDATQIAIYQANNTLTYQHSATFDLLGRKLTDVGASGQTTSYSYDNNGNPLTVTDPLGHTQTRAYDALNRPSRITDAAGGVTSVSYTTSDLPLTVAAPNGAETFYSYNGFGEMVEQLSSDSGATIYAYDADGNLTKKTDAAGIVTNYGYDALDRLLAVTYADPTLNVAYSYDQIGHGFAIGRLTGLTDAAGSLSRSYDERGNLLSEQRTTPSSQFTTSYTYDAASRVASMTYPSGARVSYTRDRNGRIRRMPFAATGADESYALWWATYLPFGPPNLLWYYTGDKDTFAYDQNYRLTNLTDTPFPGVPTLGFNWTYGYDGAGNITSITDNLTSANSQSFTYDLLNRLTSATSSGTYGSLAWSYDGNGNLLSQTNAGVTSNYSYAGGTNRLASIGGTGVTPVSLTYTPTGNIARMTPSGGTPETFSYSSANRLASVTGLPLAISSIIYDAFGKRFSKANPGSNPTTFIYDQNGNLIEENNNGTITDYLYADGRNVANWSPSQGHLYMVHTDRLGVPVLAHDLYDLTNWAAFSQPYGAMTQTVATGQFTGPLTQNLRLPGQYFDSETGFHYNMFRDYIPSLGRYLESDPIGLTGGWNPYSYVSARPLSFVDTWGLSSIVYVPGNPDGTGGQIIIVTGNGIPVGNFPAGNRVQSSAPAGQWPPGTYPYQYTNSHEDDADPDSPYGSNGIFVFDAPQCYSGGCGVHSGRSNKGGPDWYTNGCIRTTDDATSMINSLNNNGDALTTLTVLPAMSYPPGYNPLWKMFPFSPINLNPVSTLGRY